MKGMASYAITWRKTRQICQTLGKNGFRRTHGTRFFQVLASPPKGKSMKPKGKTSQDNNNKECISSDETGVHISGKQVKFHCSQSTYEITESCIVSFSVLQMILNYMTCHKSRMSLCVKGLFTNYVSQKWGVQTPLPLCQPLSVFPQPPIPPLSAIVSISPLMYSCLQT